MIDRGELRRVARERLKDAAALLSANRYDGAVYLAGYVIELALKARICRTLKWKGFPETRSEFQDYQSFRVHDLDVLLRLSGLEPRVKAKYVAEWSVAAEWNPEARYKATGSTTKADARLFVEATKTLLGVL
jgi:hypothetical protein